jgi:hypothetical protein
MLVKTDNKLVLTAELNTLLKKVEFIKCQMDIGDCAKSISDYLKVQKCISFIYCEKMIKDNNISEICDSIKNHI